MKKPSNKGSKSTKVSRTSTPSYVAVSNNIYHDGSSYRVRVQREGEKYTQNFASKKKAVTYRNALLSY